MRQHTRLIKQIPSLLRMPSTNRPISISKVAICPISAATNETLCEYSQMLDAEGLGSPIFGRVGIN